MFPHKDRKKAVKLFSEFSQILTQNTKNMLTAQCSPQTMVAFKWQDKFS